MILCKAVCRKPISAAFPKELQVFPVAVKTLSGQKDLVKWRILLLCRFQFSLGLFEGNRKLNLPSLVIIIQPNDCVSSWPKLEDAGLAEMLEAVTQTVRSLGTRI